MSIYTRWWLRHCLKCQARETPRLTVRWPVISIPLCPGPGIAVSVDYFGPLPVTPRGKTYILFFTARFSRRVDMFAVIAAEFTAASILVNRYIPLWWCPRSILSDNGLQFCSKLSYVVYELLGARKIATSSPTIQAATVVWSALTTQWPKCWLWSSTNAKTIGIRSCRTWSSPTTIRSAPPLAWPPTRFTWAGPRASLSLFSTAPGSPAIRAWPATTSHTDTATWRQNENSAPTILFGRCTTEQFPCGTAKLSVLGRFAPGSQLRCG